MEPRPPNVVQVACFHCGRTGQSWEGRTPDGWHAFAIGHHDCQQCATRYRNPGVDHPMERGQV